LLAAVFMDVDMSLDMLSGAPPWIIYIVAAVAGLSDGIDFLGAVIIGMAKILLSDNDQFSIPQHYVGFLVNFLRFPGVRDVITFFVDYISPPMLLTLRALPVNDYLRTVAGTDSSVAKAIGPGLDAVGLLLGLTFVNAFSKATGAEVKRFIWSGSEQDNHEALLSLEAKVGIHAVGSLATLGIIAYHRGFAARDMALSIGLPAVAQLVFWGGLKAYSSEEFKKAAQVGMVSYVFQYCSTVSNAAKAFACISALCLLAMGIVAGSAGILSVALPMMVSSLLVTFLPLDKTREKLLFIAGETPYYAVAMLNPTRQMFYNPDYRYDQSSVGIMLVAMFTFLAGLIAYADSVNYLKDDKDILEANITPTVENTVTEGACEKVSSAAGKMCSFFGESAKGIRTSVNKLLNCDDESEQGLTADSSNGATYQAATATNIQS